uniref:Uncharacterized protein n=1 Tax=Fagus sylvatica TaxID=28930 RepID=A0A2N9J7Z4_FAGSY
MEFSSKAFKEGNCQGQKVVHGEIMPLVLQPPEPNKGDLESLLFALKENKDWFEQMIIKNSAVLLRGYNVEKAEDFNEILEVFGWDDIRYVGPAPRTHVYKRVWTANEGPLSEFIYYHHEMVLNDTNSMRGRGWEDTFGTSDRAEAERRAKALGMELEWQPNGAVKAILGPHYLTKVFDGRKGRKMWFNTVVGMHGKEYSSAMMADGTELPENVVKEMWRNH